LCGVAMAIFSGSYIIEDDETLRKELAERGFGEQQEDYIIISPVEGLYLLENKRIKVMDIMKKRSIDFKLLLTKLKKLDRDIDIKYFVYKDLRKKGYIVRTGLKYGSYFRVYEKGIRVGEGHSHWLVQPIKDISKTSIYDIAKAVRIAHSVRKKMIWAVVDTEGDVTYYKLERIIP
jgi:tRNA-intron endonuclease